MLIWFVTLAALGVPHIAQHPAILTALLPHTGLLFIVHYPVAAFFALGAIVLVVTGAEAEGWLITVGGTPKEILAHDPDLVAALEAAEVVMDENRDALAALA